jgi:hypothetical protein
MLEILIGIEVLHTELRGNAIRELRFETGDGIDDLVIATSGGVILVQAKRNLHMSFSTDSEYSAVLRQFVDQYIRRPVGADVYLLATSNAASRKVRQDLRKLTDAMRFNEVGGAENPLSQSEQSVLDATNSLIDHHYCRVGGPPGEPARQDGGLPSYACGGVRY